MYLVESRETNRTEMQGLAGWLVAWVRRGSLFAGTRGRSERKHMRLVETLPMGPKRHLFLVSCDGERFLVGGGPDCVQTITRVRPQTPSMGLVHGGEDQR